MFTKNKARINELLEDIAVLRYHIYELKKENEELRMQLQNKDIKVHNERGGGRKKKFSEEEEARIRQLRESGMTLQRIAEELQCSVSLVHKIVSNKSD